MKLPLLLMRDHHVEALLNLPLGDDSVIPASRFADPDNGDYRVPKQAARSSCAGAFAPDALPWRAGSLPKYAFGLHDAVAAHRQTRDGE
jgi:hypothetical protein